MEEDSLSFIVEINMLECFKMMYSKEKASITIQMEIFMKVIFQKDFKMVRADINMQEDHIIKEIGTLGKKEEKAEF